MNAAVVCPECGRPNPPPDPPAWGQWVECVECNQSFELQRGLSYTFVPASRINWSRVVVVILILLAFVVFLLLGYRYL